jgi:hypothetical protein
MACTVRWKTCADGLLDKFRHIALLHALRAEEGTQGEIGFPGDLDIPANGFFHVYTPKQKNTYTPIIAREGVHRTLGGALEACAWPRPATVLRKVSVEYGTRLGNRALELIYSLTKTLPGEAISRHSTGVERLHD